MSKKGYLELRIKGERFCAYPRTGVPSALWSIYPVRGLRLGRALKFLSHYHLDKILLRHCDFPLYEFGVTEESLKNFVGAKIRSSRIDFAFAWPAPSRTTGRIYGFVLGVERRGLVGYLKVATDSKEIECLRRECASLERLAARVGDTFFKYPKLLGRLEEGDDVMVALFQPLPLDAPRWVRWHEDSWDRDISKIKESFSAGTIRHLTKEQTLNVSWVRQFLARAAKNQSDNFMRAIEHGMDVCVTHGDMACQNFRKHKGFYWVFDWEEFTDDGPMRADELSFKLSTFVYDMGRPFETSIPKMPNDEFVTAAAFQIANGLSFKNELGMMLDKEIG